MAVLCGMPTIQYSVRSARLYRTLFHQTLVAHDNSKIVLNLHAQMKMKTRMWDDAQRDSRPAEYRGRPVRKFRNSIPCASPHSLADACCWSAVQ